MSQHDYDIANASGAAVRADMNLLFAAIASNNSGATAPSTMFADMWWFDTATNLLKQRNEANSAWITAVEKDATNWKPYFGTVLLDAAAMVWTDDHKFGSQVLFDGVISPAQITSNQNNYNPTDLDSVTHLRANSDASRNVTGLAGGATGRLMLFVNVGSFNIVLTSEDAASTAGNRFLFADGDRTLTANESVLMRYDGTTSRWRAAQDIKAATPSGAIIAVTPFTGDGTWTPNASGTTAIIFCTGAGGGGGSVASGGADGGGGAGSTAIDFVADTTAVGTPSVTIGSGAAAQGTGGTSSVGALASAAGGTGTNAEDGAAGGTATAGDLQIEGGGGGAGDGAALSGPGGASFWGGGGAGVESASDGQVGEAYGSGGSGAASPAGSQTGGAGKDGVALILEW